MIFFNVVVGMMDLDSMH